MMRMTGRAAVGCAACGAVLAAAAAGLAAADRDARVITPTGSPVSLDPWRALLFDSPSVVVMLENRHVAPVASALRIWIFDATLRLKGSVDYCASELLDRNTRGHVFVPLDIAGVTVRDRAVVTIAAVGSGRTTWRLRESEAAQLSAAHAAASGSGARLAFAREDDSSEGWRCPCDERQVEALCSERCAGTALASHTATPLFNAGCAASCTCE